MAENALYAVLSAPPRGPHALRSLASGHERGMQRAMLARGLFREPSPVMTAWLERLIERALGGDGEARAAMLGVALDLLARRLRAPGEIRRLCLVARGEGHEGAAHFLGDGPPARALLLRGKLAEVSISAAHAVSQSDSHRVEPWPLRMRARRCFLRSLDNPYPHAQVGPEARRWSWRRDGGIARLLGHPDPAVIRQLLRVPELGVREVLLVAARRPTSAAIAHEIAACDRWVSQSAVREALVQNPYTPPGLTLSLSPTVSRRVLAHLASSAAFSPAVRDAAAHFAARMLQGG